MDIIMKDGFYLSVYIHVGELPHLLDVKLRHDQSVALWKKEGGRIKLIYYWELERITGLKQHSISFYNKEMALKFLDKLLTVHNLSLKDIIEIWGTPGIDNVDDYSSMDEYPDLAYHSIAHLFSAVLMDTDMFKNKEIIGFSLDGGPDNVVDIDSLEKKYYAGCYVNNGQIEVFSICSPGRLWSCAKKHYGLREGTLMALASACTSEAIIINHKIPQLQDKNSYVLSNNFFSEIENEINKIVDINDTSRFNGIDTRFSVDENKISMVMKEIQKVSIKIIENEIDRIIMKYKVNLDNTYLAMSGGYGLNCPTNSYLMKKYKFAGFMAPPCISDTGIALGIGLYAFYKKLKNDFTFKFQNAYYGNYDNNISILSNESDISRFIKSVSDLDYEIIIKDIIEAPIIWFNGRAEIGPRALGNRSILADPRNIESKDLLNKIKLREWWRPVAPIIMEEHVEEWFENAMTSPYMLHTYKAIESKKSLIPSVLHLDGSARIQTVNKNDNNDIYAIVNEFYDRTGVPIICNTSLNDRGEPIIDKVLELVNFALRKNIKIAYINSKRVEFQNHNNYLETSPINRDISEILFYDEKQKIKMLESVNPYNLNKSDIICYFDNFNLMSSLDLKDKDDVRKLKIYAKMLSQKFQTNFED